MLCILSILYLFQHNVRRYKAVLSPLTVGTISEYGIDTGLETSSHRLNLRRLVTIVINDQYHDEKVECNAGSVSSHDIDAICKQLQERTRGYVKPHVDSCRAWFDEVGLIPNIYCIHNVYILMVLILCSTCARCWISKPPWARPTCVASSDNSSTARRSCLTLTLLPKILLGRRPTEIGFNPVRSVFVSVYAVI
jgi:hypothetical protein